MSREKIIVAKFGGTSMGDRQCMVRSAEVAIKQNASLVVVSAVSGITNQLIELGRVAESGKPEEQRQRLNEIIERHRLIGRELNLSSDRQAEMNWLFQELESIAQGIHLLKDRSAKAMDTMMSLGERLSSILFCQALEEALKGAGKLLTVHWFDARKAIITDDNYGTASPQISATAERCQKLLLPLVQDANSMTVTQGFLGGTPQGHTTTLGRGGSDYSAALFAEALNAQQLDIWTDVAGIATTDPRLCPKARAIPEIAFSEASELATFGAKILHPATLAPAIRKNIPVFVGSSFSPDQAGTWIRKTVPSGPLVRALALRKQQVLLTLTTPEMLNAHGFLYKIFQVFFELKISVDAITTSEISVALTLDPVAAKNPKLIESLSRFAQVSVEENLCLVALIGNNVNHTAGLAKQIFSELSDVNIRMICQGASKHNFCFLVPDEKGPEVIQRLHRSFIEVAPV